MERQHDDGALVPDDLPQGFATVRQLHPIDLEVEDPSLVDALSSDLLFQKSLVSAHLTSNTITGYCSDCPRMIRVVPPDRPFFSTDSGINPAYSRPEEKEP
jgi:hypothetical protein